MARHLGARSERIPVQVLADHVQEGIDLEHHAPGAQCERLAVQTAPLTLGSELIELRGIDAYYQAPDENNSQTQLPCNHVDRLLPDIPDFRMIISTVGVALAPKCPIFAYPSQLTNITS